VDVDLYLDRIGYTGSREPDLATLRALHLANLYAVPFENLDIHLGHEILLSLTRLYEKVVVRRRGGFCYELNSLFGWLLRQLGFKVSMLAARVYSGAQPGLPFDHMLLYLSEHQLIADVGFGDSFMEPMPLDGRIQTQDGSNYRIVDVEGEWTLQRRKPNTDWESQYCFTQTPRRLGEYEDMCRYQQTSPESSFTRKTVCSLAMQDGRITLANGRFIVTKFGSRREEPITDESAYRTILSNRFGMELDVREPVHRLLSVSGERAL